MKNFLKHYYSQILCVLVSAAIFFCAGAVFSKAIINSRGLETGISADASEGAQLVGKDEQGNDVTVPASKAILKAAEIQQYLDQYFIGDIDETEMGDGIAEGMMAGTGDRWSYYISKEDFDSYMEGMNNAYVGVGITIQLVNEDDAGFTVMEVTEGGPAEAAGVRAGDMLTKVEGEDVVTLGMTETKNRVRGEEGTQVLMTFVRDGVETDYTITRQSIAVENIKYELLDDKIGYISIGNFDSNCARDTIAAIEALQEQGAEKLIFDVRFNPGGMKDELVELLDYLLPEGKLFISEDYTGKESIDYSDAQCVDMEMAVLVNGDSYSAAEFFAAALREYGVATVVGTQTCGKGYFQTTFQLSDGSAIAISIGKYRTPNGVSLAEAGGLVPDEVVEVDDETYVKLYYGQVEHQDDEQLQAAIAALNR